MSNSNRAAAPGRWRVQPLPLLHLELWVTRRRDRARATRILRRSYSVARRITKEGGGFGPWVFLVDADPPDPKTVRLRATLALKPEEDLWAELVFYPSKVRAGTIIRRIWKDPRFAIHAAALDGLVSRRKAGYAGILAYARLKPL